MAQSLVFRGREGQNISFLRTWVFPYSDQQFEMGTEVQVLQGNMHSEVAAYIENLVFSSVSLILKLLLM